MANRLSPKKKQAKSQAPSLTFTTLVDSAAYSATKAYGKLYAGILMFEVSTSFALEFLKQKVNHI